MFGSIPGLPANNFRDQDHHNRTIRLYNGKANYRGYTIEEKKDFGKRPFLIFGFGVTHGYVVTDGGIVNEMPGGCWFLTVHEAMRGIDDLIDSKRGFVDARNEHPFWTLHRFRRNAEERAPELALLLQHLVNLVDNHQTSPGCTEDARKLLDQIDLNCDMRPTTVHVDGRREKTGPRTFGRFGGIMPSGVANRMMQDTPIMNARHAPAVDQVGNALAAVNDAET